MDRLNKIFIGLVCLASFTLHAQQGEKAMQTEGKHGLTINGMRYSTGLSLSYSYRFWMDEKQTLRTGLQAGFGYGGNFDRYGGWAFPLGIYAEYGKKHRFGFDANVVYQYSTTEILGQIPNPDNMDFQNLRVVFDNGVFTSSLYYSFNFGQNLRYNAGLGYNIQHYFGSNYGLTFDDYPLEHAPFIFFGIRF
jgi:hypothetical protein